VCERAAENLSPYGRARGHRPIGLLPLPVHAGDDDRRRATQPCGGADRSGPDYARRAGAEYGAGSCGTARPRARYLRATVALAAVAGNLRLWPVARFQRRAETPAATADRRSVGEVFRALSDQPVAPIGVAVLGRLNPKSTPGSDASQRLARKGGFCGADHRTRGHRRAFSMAAQPEPRGRAAGLWGPAVVWVWR